MGDFKEYNLDMEALDAIKFIHGLKDAFRAWRKELHQVFIQGLGCRQLYVEPELHVVHEQNDHNGNWCNEPFGPSSPNTIERAVEHA